MRVHLIKKQTIEDYAIAHSGSRLGLNLYLTLLRYADWETPEDILATFGTADLLGNGTCRVVFNIGGNKYRMIGKYHFGAKEIHLFVCWIGTHAQYTTLCNENKQYHINQY